MRPRYRPGLRSRIHPPAPNVHRSLRPSPPLEDSRYGIWLNSTAPAWVLSWTAIADDRLRWTAGHRMAFHWRRKTRFVIHMAPRSSGSRSCTGTAPEAARCNARTSPTPCVVSCRHICTPLTAAAALLAPRIWEAPAAQAPRNKVSHREDIYSSTWSHLQKCTTLDGKTVRHRPPSTVPPLSPLSTENPVENTTKVALQRHMGPAFITTPYFTGSYDGGAEPRYTR